MTSHNMKRNPSQNFQFCDGSLQLVEKPLLREMCARFRRGSSRGRQPASNGMTSPVALALQGLQRAKRGLSHPNWGGKVTGCRLCDCLPSCLAILPGEVPSPTASAVGGPPISFLSGGSESPRTQGLASGKALARAGRRGPPHGRAQENFAARVKRAGHKVSGPSCVDAITCPAAWRSPRRSSPASSRCPRPSRSERRP